jgi:hypothetical protein
MIASRMFAVLAPCLLSAIRRDPLAVPFAALPDLCQSRIPFACSRPILRAEKWRAKKCETTRICQVSQNEHLQNRGTKAFRINTCTKYGETYHRALSRRRRRYNSFAFTFLSDPHNELPWNHTLTKKGGGVGGRFYDPFAIARDRAMINIP